jgi:uncharacterized OB-fold protein
MAALPADWGVPELDTTNRAWFTSGALAVQQCATCGVLQHPPEEVCHQCGGTSFDVNVLAPRGRVHSYTVVHYAANRALVDAVPYTVVLVSLDDAPHLRVVGNIEGDVEIGMPVVPYWEERTAEDGTVVLLPQWRKARSEPGASRS